LAGQRSQRGYLNITFLFHLFQTRIVVFELGVLGAELVEVGNLAQHLGIRTGDSREAKHTDCRPGQKHVQVLDGNGDLTKLSRFVPGYEKYVETFTQYPSSAKQIFCFGILPELELSRAGSES